MTGDDRWAAEAAVVVRAFAERAAGDFNRTIKQAINYCRREFADQRPSLRRLQGQRVEFYVFPAPADGFDYQGGRPAGVERRSDLGARR